MNRTRTGAAPAWAARFFLAASAPPACWPRPALRHGQRRRAAVVLPPPAVDEPAARPPHRDRRVRRRLLLGRAGRVPAREGRHQRRLGLSGGEARTAQYETVSDGDTGHAESVQVTFDPTQVSYGKLLQMFFSVAHDPTELNYQGPDDGTQYRSAIFPLDDEQRKVATAYVAQLRGGQGVPGARSSRKSRPSRASIRPRATTRTS